MADMGETTATDQGGMRPYTADRYKRLVEDSPNEGLQAYMEAERQFLASVEDSSSRTFVELGAGHGRALPLFAEVARNAICVELNQDMLAELRVRSEQHRDVTVIDGDVQLLPHLLQGLDLVSPVVALLQNTLGTIEGDERRVLRAMKQVAKGAGGDVVLSLFRQGALADWGMEMYGQLSEMIGEPDPDRTDFRAGLFASRTGYVSKWWTDEEVEEMRAFFGGQLVREVVEPAFVILQMRP
jgi:SAM-dependent methyltransferase